MKRKDRIKPITKRAENMPRMLQIWQTAVSETHTFLSSADIHSLKPEVQQGVNAVEHLYGFFDEDGMLQGFIGVDNGKTEMLFVNAEARGQGVGKQLLCFAITNLNAQYVDVNEQNEQGIGFYRHMGFVVEKRSAHDSQGRPFPILHLVYQA